MVPPLLTRPHVWDYPSTVDQQGPCIRGPTDFRLLAFWLHKRQAGREEKPRTSSQRLGQRQQLAGGNRRVKGGNGRKQYGRMT